MKNPANAKQGERPYLTLGQIDAILERVGQPQGSVLLTAFFNAYRRTLTSDDVRELYDRTCFAGRDLQLAVHR